MQLRRETKTPYGKKCLILVAATILIFSAILSFQPVARAAEIWAPSPRVNLTVVAGAGGSVSPSGVLVLYVGLIYQFNATPAAGYSFNYWNLSGTDIGSANPLFLNITAAMNGETLTAEFTTSVPPPPPSVIPEVPFGTIIACLSMIAALAGFAGFRRFRPKLQLKK
jgi:hypothetical protein